jgi:hypothetical protein
MNFPAYTPSLHPADVLVPQSQQKFYSPRIVVNRSQITETKHNNLSDENRREVGVVSRLARDGNRLIRRRMRRHSRDVSEASKPRQNSRMDKFKS